MSTNIQHPIVCYGGRTKDWELLLDSTSGGVFTELANVVLAEGGVVCGAAWSKDFLRVEHRWVETTEGLSDLRGSKYVASDMTHVYGPLKKFLIAGRTVLFVGTPCQTAAIRKNYGQYPNLLLCALICMATPEPKAWVDFVLKIKEKACCKILSVKFRAKTAGLPGHRFQMSFSNSRLDERLSRWGKRYLRRFPLKPRTCCLMCQFRGRSFADIQIGDYWGVQNYIPDLADGYGASAILVFTSKGAELLRRTTLELRETRYENILRGNPYLEKQYVPSPPPPFSLYRFLRSTAGRILRKVGLR